MTVLLLPFQFVVVQLLSCVQLCDLMDCSMPGFPVLHGLPEFAQIHVHWIGDTIQPFYFSCPIAVTRTSKTVLIKSTLSGHHCFVLDLRGNTFRFSPLSMMLAVCLSYMAFIMLRYVPFIHIFWGVFIINGCWILSEAFLHLLRWSYSFYSSVR